MSDFTRWTEGQINEFPHKLAEILHGPNPGLNAKEIGFAIAIFPMTQDAKVRLLSNQPQHIVEVVLHQVLMSFNPNVNPIIGNA